MAGCVTGMLVTGCSYVDKELIDLGVQWARWCWNGAVECHWEIVLEQAVEHHSGVGRS